MGEWKRIFCDSKRILLFFVITVMNLFFFVETLVNRMEPGALEDMLAAQSYSRELTERYRGHDYDEMLEMYDEDEKKLRDVESLDSFPYLAEISYDPYRSSLVQMYFLQAGEEIKSQIEYLKDYQDNLLNIQARAAQLQQVGIFSKGGGFTSKNITKTAKDFQKLEGIQVSFGSNAGFEHWLAYGFADYFFLAVIVLTVFAFLEERRKGLWHVIRSCSNGRARFGFTRIGILCVSSSAGVLFLYVLPLVVSLSISGGWEDLGRSVQSLESMRNCILHMTIGGWLLRFLATKVICGVFLGAFLWCVLGTLANAQFSLSVLCCIFVVEYLLYELIPVQSWLNILKYLNLFSYVHTTGLYAGYLNINLFGNPVNIQSLMRDLMPFAACLTAVWAILIQALRRPEGNRDILSRISIFLSGVFDRFRTRLRIGGWEVYKALIYEFGILILAIVWAACGRLHYRGVDMNIGNDVTYYQYVRDREGSLEDSADDYLARARASADHLSDSESADRLAVLDRLEKTVTDLQARAKEGGYEPWLVYEPSYDVFFGNSAFFVQRLNGTAALLSLVFLCVPLLAYERGCGTVMILRSSPKGRKTVFRWKAFMAVFYAAFVWAAIYLRELAAFLSECQGKSLGAPVQNMDALAEFPLKLSIRQYLILLYGIRLLMLICAAFLILWIGGAVRGILSGYLLGMGIFVIPALLTVFGLVAMRYLSPLLPVSSAELMWKMGGGNLLYLLPWAILLVFGMAALAAARRKWVTGRTFG